MKSSSSQYIYFKQLVLYANVFLKDTFACAIVNFSVNRVAIDFSTNIYIIWSAVTFLDWMVCPCFVRPLHTDWNDL